MGKDRLISIVPSNRKLADISESDIEYSLSNYNFEQGVATVETGFSAQVIMNEVDDLIKRKRLVNLNEDQINKFLESEEKFDSFELKFFPSFIRKAPSLVDRIKIQIAK